MRRGIYFVLMVVLVLRGLMGTAMANGVVPPLATAHVPVHAAVAVQSAAAPHGADSHESAVRGDGQANGHDHRNAVHASHSHAVPSCGGGVGGDCVPHDHHAQAGTCSACEICHSAMLGLPAAPSPAAPLGDSLRAPTAAPFDSAPSALAIKPPIA